jgi:hypothetical protein
VPTQGSSAILTGVSADRQNTCCPCIGAEKDYSAGLGGMDYEPGVSPGFGPRSTLTQADGDEINGLRWAIKRMKFSFTAYAEAAFADLRENFYEIGPARYAASLRGQTDAHFDGGKSGAIFFFSQDQVRPPLPTSSARTSSCILV